MEKQRILGFWGHPICLYCGKQIDEHYEENDKIYECDCLDAVKKEELKTRFKY
ncbi:MAG: hypothetical protein PF487_05845 [Bacteroidales bacterium]|jgi:hypothetical protein|nr:hypothetical protein [Bacteroidales bacterium]